MIELVTRTGTKRLGMEETRHGVGHLYTLLSEIEKMTAEDKLLLVICRRPDTKLTLFDMMLNTLRVGLLILTPNTGILYPSGVLKRRAAALCVNA